MVPHPRRRRRLRRALPHAPALARRRCLAPRPRVALLAAGVFILRGHNWARWLALGWIAFHVAVSFYDSLSKVIAHTIILLIFVAILFNPAARAWFKAQSQAHTNPPNPA
jgi:hypothetical protein